MKAKYDGRCTVCGGAVEAGDEVRFNGRGRGVRHADTATCDDFASYRAESLQEQQMERWAEARFAGATSSFWEDEDFLRDRRMGGY